MNLLQAVQSRGCIETVGLKPEYDSQNQIQVNEEAPPGRFN